MATAREIISGLGLEDVGSYVNSGNIVFSSGGKAADHEAAIRSALEREFGFELTTFVRTAAQVRVPFLANLRTRKRRRQYTLLREPFEGFREWEWFGEDHGYLMRRKYLA